MTERGGRDASLTAPISGVRAVLFDLDGTLADSEPLIAQAVSESCAAFGYSVRPEQVRERIGPPMPVMLQSLLPIDLAEALAIYEDYQARYNGTFVPRTQPLPGAIELLDALRGRGAPMAVVTNKNEIGGKTLVEALGWTSRFAVVVGMDTAAKAKPAPDPAIHALAVIGATPGEGRLRGRFRGRHGLRRRRGHARRDRHRRAAQARRPGGAGGTHLVDDLRGVSALLAAAGRT